LVRKPGNQEMFEIAAALGIAALAEERVKVKAGTTSLSNELVRIGMHGSRRKWAFVSDRY
jgi:hypothetical protein